jgi:type IV secretory pathway VirB2 component (pilin)
MKQTLAIASLILALSANLAAAQSNPNQGVTTGTNSNTQQLQGSQAGNPNNPGPRGY